MFVPNIVLLFAKSSSPPQASIFPTLSFLECLGKMVCRNVIVFFHVLNRGFAIMKMLPFMLSPQLYRTNLALNCTLKLKVKRKL